MHERKSIIEQSFLRKLPLASIESTARAFRTKRKRHQRARTTETGLWKLVQAPPGARLFHADAKSVKTEDGGLARRSSR
ncbi:hypothetical protein KC363_g237 [Hortaea werneckii]|nr:hypothetical protein KC363_g237 [Hortaea werneckii]